MKCELCNNQADTLIGGYGKLICDDCYGRKIMKTVRVFKLVRPAKNKGGDRYEALTSDHGGEQMTFYVPQVVCRLDGVPAKTLTITIERTEAA
jgi:hypothetical protein